MQRHTFPKSNVDVYCLVLESGGSDVAVAISAASLALADAGIEMYDLVSACSVVISHCLCLFTKHLRLHCSHALSALQVATVLLPTVSCCHSYMYALCIFLTAICRFLTVHMAFCSYCVYSFILLCVPVQVWPTLCHLCYKLHNSVPTDFCTRLCVSHPSGACSACNCNPHKDHSQLTFDLKTPNPCRAV